MKKLFIVVLSVIATKAFAIHYPSLEQVATKLYGNYRVPEYGSDTTVAYEKKRDGWHIVKSAVPKGGDSFVPVKNELFWSSVSGKYQTLTMFPKGLSHKFVERVRHDKYFNAYDFERCPYYGYEGWYADVITDFGATTPANDTLVEALARAYNSMASGYIGMQYGFEIPSQKNLPENERLDLYVVNSKKSIAMYDVLRKRNVHFAVLIGEVSTKYANEIMAHYEAMIRYNREAEFNDYFNEDLYDPFTRGIAKSMLENCNTDGILFTNGDNDTFPLWYMQWIKGVRKDVAVMNLSLMNIDHYLERYRSDFKGGKAVKYTLTPEQYRMAEYFPVKTTAVEKVSSAQFFSNIADTVMTDGDTVLIANNYIFEIRNADDAYSKYELLSGRSSATIKILSRYLLQGDMAALDIICANHESRSIYFSSSMSAPNCVQPLLYQEGIIWRFIPDDSGVESKLYTAFASAKIAGEKLQAVLTMDTTCVDRVTGRYWTIMIRSAAIALSNVLLTQKDTTGAVVILDKAYSRFPFTTWPPEAVDYYAVEAYYSTQRMEAGDKIANLIMDQIETDNRKWQGKSVLNDDENSDKMRAQTILNILVETAKSNKRSAIEIRAAEMRNKIK